MRAITSPALYAACLVLVAASLLTSYFVDPYVFGITTLILGFASAAVAVLAIVVCAFKPLERRAKLAILSFMALTGISIVAALALLRTFKWA